jgi:hypothetical protein
MQVPHLSDALRERVSGTLVRVNSGCQSTCTRNSSPGANTADSLEILNPPRKRYGLLETCFLASRHKASRTPEAAIHHALDSQHKRDNSGLVALARVVLASSWLPRRALRLHDQLQHWTASVVCSRIQMLTSLRQSRLEDIGAGGNRGRSRRDHAWTGITQGDFLKTKVIWNRDAAKSQKGSMMRCGRDLSVGIGLAPKQRSRGARKPRQHQQAR